MTTPTAVRSRLILESIIMKTALLAILLVFTSLLSFAQENTGEVPPRAPEQQATVGASIGPDGSGSIIVEAHGKRPDPPLFYNTKVNSRATFSPKSVYTVATIEVNIIQGKAKVLSYRVMGDGDVTGVSGEGLKSWAVRQDPKGQRFLDITLEKPDEVTKPLNFKAVFLTEEPGIPGSHEVPHLMPTERSAGFDQVVSLTFANGLKGIVRQAEGFRPIDGGDEDPTSFQTSNGGILAVSFNRSSAIDAPVELTGFEFNGRLADDGKSVVFAVEGTAKVAKKEASIILLSGQAAASTLPKNPAYAVQLVPHGKNAVAYELTFNRTGSFPVSFEFIAPVTREKEWKRLNFQVASGAVSPLRIHGLPEVEFRHDTSVAPRLGPAVADAWSGFIPASGQCHLAWKESRKIGEGKLFFSTTAKVESTVSAGLLRQNHAIDYRVLQGELESLSIAIQGEGEILDVQGTNVVGWTIVDEGDYRCLEIRLSQAIKDNGQIHVRSQLPLDAFPVRVAGMRLTPRGAVRHSGFIRLSNQGSVRLEPTGLEGLTQLAPEQFPGDAISARQVFVYRFPAAQRQFEVVADRIQPEVNVSELVLYQLAETDRLITADIELDIREAPIREWDFLIPEDYSVVTASGAAIADYIVASDTADGRRNLKLIFSADVQGRQLINLQLEKNEPATAGDWDLPELAYPDANSVRGDIGIVGAPGFRIAVGATDLLVEKPLSYFPKPVPNLQQAFRIRERGWTATMQIELLEKSVQADLFHLYSLSEGTAYGSVLANYFITGAPVSELRLTVPEDLGNVSVDGKDVRSFRQDADTLIVSLHQPVMGPYTILVTFEEKLDSNGGTLQPGRVAPVDVQGERGYLQVVSPMQVDTEVNEVSENLLKLDALELPAEFRLLSAAPSLGSWQYTERPFNISLNVQWFDPGNTVTQVVEFSDVTSRVSPDGELVTDIIYYVKSRGQRALKVQLPDATLLWAVTVAGKSVTARQADNATLIPLPGGTDPNIPVEVRLRLGRPAVEGRSPRLVLPLVEAPVLKTEWQINGDEKHVLIPTNATVEPPTPVLRPSGFDWITRRGISSLIWITILTGAGIWLTRRKKLLRIAGLFLIIAGIVVASSTALHATRYIGAPHPLQLSLPVLTAGETIELTVNSIPRWKANLVVPGVVAAGLGVLGLVASFLLTPPGGKSLFRATSLLLLLIGLVVQRDGAALFYAGLAASLLLLLLFPRFREWFSDVRKHLKEQSRAKKEAASKQNSPGPDAGTATASILIGALLLGGLAGRAEAQAEGLLPATMIEQTWTIEAETRRLNGKGEITVTGDPGDSFLLLRAHTVLTEFESDELRLSRQNIPNLGLCYVVSIPAVDKPTESDDPFAAPPLEPSPFDPPSVVRPPAKPLKATFEFQLEIKDVTAGFQLPTGSAAVQRVKASYDKTGWEFVSAAAVRIEPGKGGNQTSANILLSPQPNVQISLRPKARDVSTEETQFFVEASNLYLPSPGVIDGRHRIHVRPAQGEVKSLSVRIPDGLTVSEVTGPINSWQFDAESGVLAATIEPAQSAPFNLLVETQRGLDPLPADVELSPLRIDGAAGEVGLIGLAFGPDAQPEKVDSETLSVVNLGDFEAGLLPNEQTVLHRVYRYGADGGSIALRVAAVAPEVRVTSTQVLSLGDERIVLGINFTAEITRAGLFQLSFPLPEGLEVESLSGGALDHWSELSEGDQRQIILHLNGKTMGAQGFALSLTGPAPEGAADWDIPRFELNEATRQTGDLVVKPTTGIRLQTVNRINVSEIDPRTLGGDAKGSLAYRLLQKNWALSLGVEILDPWITGQALHEVTLREGQTRTTLMANFNVANASIRSLPVRLPISDADEIKALRASGSAVSDLVRTAPDSDIWEIQFKRRVVGKVDVRIEYERRGDRANETESLQPIEFPEARQLSYYFSVRAGGRLELEAGELPSGWQHADWNSVPQALREAGNRNAPVLTLRIIAPEEALEVRARRHSLAEALKLRVANGSLTTVLSPVGDQLTAVDLTMEVIQRSSLTVQLPKGGELFSIFVNGESVYSVRKGDAWQFYILPGSDDQTATVWFAYSVPGDKLAKVGLSSPQLNVPLENIQWNVLAPKGFELTDSSGNLELKEQQYLSKFDRSSYLSKAKGIREEQARKAAKLLEQANDLLQSGEQSKARWAFNSVANQYALDAASNEDARVQLENLQTQQAIVGLNTRRQRLVLDNFEEDVAQNTQLKEGADRNRILQQGDLNYRPQELSEILRGNTTEDNAVLQRIAGQLVKHQRTSVPAPQAITITLPEGGTAYSFNRTVQVSENAPLELDLKFDSTHRLNTGKAALVLLLLVALVGGVARGGRKAQAA